MSYLPIILIVLGYGALVASFGWMGLALVAVHVIILLVASHLNERRHKQ